jgi:hypothetical protein
MSGTSKPRVVTVDLDATRRRIPEMWAQIAELTREVRGLEAIVELAENPRYGAGCRWDLPSPDLECTASAEHAQVRGPTYREMIRTVLADQATTLGVRQILDAIRARFGAEPDRNTISSLLRKLADRGEVVHDAAAAKWGIGKGATVADQTGAHGEVVDGRFGSNESEEVPGRSAA